MNYIGRIYKDMTIPLYLMTKSRDKKLKARFTIPEITNQDFRKLLKKFKNSPYICYKMKQVHIEVTDAFFCIK